MLNFYFNDQKKNNSKRIKEVKIQLYIFNGEILNYTNFLKFFFIEFN
jgi:hypothetical protein